MEEQNLMEVLQFLQTIDPQASARDKYMAGMAGLQALESIMRIREQRRSSRRARTHPIWFGNENGQNVRQTETKRTRPVHIPENLEKILEIEVEVAVRPRQTAPAAELPQDN